MKNQIIRCPWAEKTEEERNYHDNEWGRPLHDERKLFEMLILEGQQAGLSWSIILKKRENFRMAYDNFDPEKIVRYDNKKIHELLMNPGIIRNKLKINAVISNAKAYLELKESEGSLDNYLWRFVDNKPIINHWKEITQIPVKTQLSDHISKDLKKRGFKFAGSTIIYSYLQATGIVNDHLMTCCVRSKISG